MGRGLRHEKAEYVLRLALMMQAARSGISLQDIMQEFEVSRRTAERMRDAVERVFPQVECVESGERTKRWRIPPGAFSRLVDCSPEQLASLHLARELLLKEGHIDKADDLKSIDLALKGAMRPEKLSKMEPDLEALTLAEGIAMRPGPKPELSSQSIKLLREAILAMQKIKIRYKGRESGKISTQTLYPYGFLYGRKSYLVAFSEKAKDMRLWLIANMNSVEILGQSFDRDPEFNLEAYAANSFGVFQEEVSDVELLFDADIAEDVKNFYFHPSQSIEVLEDGRVRVTFKAGGLTEMCWHLFTWGPSVEIVKPIELRQRMKEMCDYIGG